MAFKKYDLSDEEVVKIARLCVQEQGCVAGVRAEASQGANLLETNATYRRKFGSDIYSMFRNSGWYYKAAHFMDYGSASQASIDAVREVLCEGRRIFPQYVDEHDCIDDIEWVKLSGKYVSKYDKSCYVRDKSVIHNKMGSTYTFYDFPASGCDPFGYTADAFEYVTSHGGDVEPSDPSEDDGDDRVNVICTLPELYKGCKDGPYVKLWRYLIGMKTNSGAFNSAVVKNTKIWQKEHGLKDDGIVGKKTWSCGLSDFE